VKSNTTRPVSASAAPSVAPPAPGSPSSYNDQSDDARRARAEAHNQSAAGAGYGSAGYAGTSGYAGGAAGSDQHAGTAARAAAPAYSDVAEASRPASARPGSVQVEADGVTPRVARLTIASIDPWSALKVSFLLSVAAVIALLIGVAVLWLVLDGIGVFDQLNKVLGTVGLDTQQNDFDIYKYVGFSKVLSIAIVIGVINAALLTALATVGTLLYNLSAGLVGGVRVTLSDD
jgi:hypothetical protein